MKSRKDIGTRSILKKLQRPSAGISRARRRRLPRWIGFGLSSQASLIDVGGGASSLVETRSSNRLEKSDDSQKHARGRSCAPNNHEAGKSRRQNLSPRPRRHGDRKVPDIGLVAFRRSICRHLLTWYPAACPTRQTRRSLASGLIRPTGRRAGKEC